MIILNNKPVDWKEGMTISDVLKTMKLQFPLTVVSVNDQRISPEKYDSFEIEDHSKVKVVYVCHGG